MINEEMQRFNNRYSDRDKEVNYMVGAHIMNERQQVTKENAEWKTKRREKEEGKIEEMMFGWNKGLPPEADITG